MLNFSQVMVVIFCMVGGCATQFSWGSDCAKTSAEANNIAPPTSDSVEVWIATVDARDEATSSLIVKEMKLAGIELGASNDMAENILFVRKTDAAKAIDILKMLERTDRTLKIFKKLIPKDK